MNSDEVMTRVNSATLASMSGRPVALVGTVKQVDASATNIRVEASDGQIILVKLNEPLTFCDIGEVIEFQGIAQGRMVLAHSGYKYSNAEAFNMEMYNEAVKLIHTLKDHPYSFD